MTAHNKPLIEVLGNKQSGIISEAVESDNGGKDLYLTGIFIQGDVRNQNGRIYPTNEIKSAVQYVNERIDQGFSILGEADHPETLQVNIDRVSHVIQSMWCTGADGMGKLKIIDKTPMGQIIRAIVESGVKLGVSSRGSGDLDSRGYVSNFEIVTVDIVANPSAPNAYPRPIYESLINMNHGHKTMELAAHATVEERARQALHNDVIKFIRTLNKT